MGEPFASGGAVFGRAAEEFEFAVEVLDEAGVAKSGDGFGALAGEVFEDILCFHAVMMHRGNKAEIAKAAQ